MKQPRVLPISVLVLLAAGVFGGSQASTPAPPRVNYQGVLRNPGGAPLSGTFDMILRLFDASTAGNEILQDRHTTLESVPVTVSGGLFNVAIGSGSVSDGSGPGTFTDLRLAFQAYSNVYLEIQVGEETLSPRTQVVSAPYALGGPRGVVFTRWGKSSCPTGTSLVYTGYPAAGYYNSTGNNTNQLCLASVPTWDQFDPSDGSGAELHGTEYEFAGTFLSFLTDQDAVCAVCLQPDADIVFMYPGSQACPVGWHAEYVGYIVAPHYTAVGKDAVCMDHNPEGRPGGGANTNGNLWYLTEARCGALPCGPYVDFREVTCSVCSR